MGGFILSMGALGPPDVMWSLPASAAAASAAAAAAAEAAAAEAGKLHMTSGGPNAPMESMNPPMMMPQQGYAMHPLQMDGMAAPAPAHHLQVHPQQYQFQPNLQQQPVHVFHHPQQHQQQQHLLQHQHQHQHQVQHHQQQQQQQHHYQQQQVRHVGAGAPLGHNFSTTPMQGPNFTPNGMQAFGFPTSSQSLGTPGLQMSASSFSSLHMDVQTRSTRTNRRKDPQVAVTEMSDDLSNINFDGFGDIRDANQDLFGDSQSGSHQYLPSPGYDALRSTNQGQSAATQSETNTGSRASQPLPSQHTPAPAQNTRTSDLQPLEEQESDNNTYGSAFDDLDLAAIIDNTGSN
mmetsp:Transcript_8901/g.16383  ORF Transcript_8901/g.16383 Transcript_8901/m.16383 type:complete len:347 (-) Transcript_8901:587-1627(-)